MRKKPFVQPDKYGILIPYSDFMKLVDVATKVDKMEKQYDTLVQQYGQLKGQFLECMEKLRDIDHQLQD